MTPPLATAAEHAVIVGLGELKLSDDADVVLTCLGLGSCVGVTAYDSVNKVAGMAHVVLPQDPGKGTPATAKFANVAIPLLIEEMVKRGAVKRNLLVKLAGGAQMSIAAGLGSTFQIGEKNQAAVKDLLKKLGVRIAGETLGGNKGRSLRLWVGTGKTTVSSAGEEPREL